MEWCFLSALWSAASVGGMNQTSLLWHLQTLPLSQLVIRESSFWVPSNEWGWCSLWSEYYLSSYLATSLHHFEMYVIQESEDNSLFCIPNTMMQLCTVYSYLCNDDNSGSTFTNIFTLKDYKVDQLRTFVYESLSFSHCVCLYFYSVTLDFL